MPIMIEPKITQIFIRRFKHLKKLKELSQLSLSQLSSSSFGSGSLSFSFDEDFLKDINLQYSQLMNDESSQLLNGLEYFQQEHYIYESVSNKQNKIHPLENIQKLNFRETKIEHLIMDFKEIDLKSLITFYKDIKKSKNGSIILSEIIEEKQKITKQYSQSSENKIPKISKLSSQSAKRSDPMEKQRLIPAQIQRLGNKLITKQHKNTLIRQNLEQSRKIAVKCVYDYKRLWGSIENQEEKIEKRRTQLTNRRQKIREKAQRLLQGMRISS